MTPALEKAFAKAARLSEELQNQLAVQILEDVECELNWEEALAKTPETLDKLANRAGQAQRAGKTRRRGFDQI